MIKKVITSLIGAWHQSGKLFHGIGHAAYNIVEDKSNKERSLTYG
jgi:hypothetical protein